MKNKKEGSRRMNAKLIYEQWLNSPVYDDEIKKELIETFEIGWKANVKARIHSADLLNQYRKRGDEKPFRAQQEMYNYYQNKLDVIAEELQ